MKRLAPNAWVKTIPLETVPYLSLSFQHTLIYMALGHRWSQTSGESDSSSRAVLKARMFDHRGQAIQAIHDVLDDVKLRGTDRALLNVLLLLFGEVGCCSHYHEPSHLRVD